MDTQNLRSLPAPTSINCFEISLACFLLTLQVTNAITRQKKEEIVSTIRENLKGSVIVFGMRFKGLDVST